MCDHCGCRRFPGIAELTAEHETILALAWEVAEATRAGRPPDPVVPGQLATLLRTHVVKEETGIYPLLRAAGTLDSVTANALEAEHRDTDAVLDGGRFDRLAFYALAAHIEQEEMELFPEAMFAFDEEEWDALDDAHRAADREGEVAADQRRR